ncbi:DUF4397 domain-containing protein [Sphingobacteruim zhuxiongii]|nr:MULTISPECIES: DUF4397 domain-containing protein [unclassified Sphingobacterium]
MSCQKDDLSSDLPHNQTTFSGAAAYNAIYGSLGLDFKIDDKVLNTNEYFDLGSFVRHKSVFPGERSISLYNREKNSEVFRAGQQFSASKVYSLFFYGRDKIEMKVVEDNLITPPAGKVKVRFANFGNNVSKDLKILKGQSTSIGDRTLAVHEVSYFHEFNSSELRFQFSNKSDISFVGISFVPEDRSVYTVFLVPRMVSNQRELQEVDYEIKIIKHN